MPTSQNRRNRTGVSPELVRHHLRLHAERCPSMGERQRFCPCGKTVVIVCTSCDEMTFVCVAPDTWCQHAEDLMLWLAQ